MSRARFGEDPGAVTRFPLPPNRLPALEPLLDGPLWNRWARDGKVFPLDDLRAAVRYVRLKPTTSCRLLVLADEPGDVGAPPRGFLLHLYTDGERARTAFEKVASRPTFEPAEYRAFLSTPHAVVAVPFPNDLDVPGLRHIYWPHRLKRALSRVLTGYPDDTWEISKRLTTMRLLAYKPGRRAVLRVDARITHRTRSTEVRLPLHLKVESRDTYPASHERLVAIHEAIPDGVDWGVPQPLGRVDKRWLTVADWVEGQTLAELVSDDEAAVDAMRRAGRALAGLHALGPPSWTIEPSEERCRRLEQLAADLGELLPQEQSRLTTLGRRLSRLARELGDSTATTVHGDFHLGQVIIAEDRTVLVDLDRADAGPAELDLGALRAHLVEIGAPSALDAAFLEGYTASAGEAPPPRSLAAATAIGLFRRAVFPFRGLQANWPAAVLSCVANVERLCEELA